MMPMVVMALLVMPMVVMALLVMPMVVMAMLVMPVVKILCGHAADLATRRSVRRPSSNFSHSSGEPR
jgi:hypothetical protein